MVIGRYSLQTQTNTRQVNRKNVTKDDDGLFI